MEKETTRRTFIGNAVLAGGAAAAGAQSIKAQTKPKLPATDLLRIGVVALGDNSHLNYEIWAPMINSI
ncbi:MAG: twin-arginine translocation signal domain-containing protein, partial [Candidatus Latescibacterota bacterium]